MNWRWKFELASATEASLQPQLKINRIRIHAMTGISGECIPHLKIKKYNHTNA
jgi:hypothetical protein